MIVVTGAAGFIGSCLVKKLNDLGHKDLILVDDFTVESKERNLINKSYFQKIPRSIFFDWLQKHDNQIDFIFHIGARTDTTEFNKATLKELNIDYSKKIWNYCTKFKTPLVYASSAATYGIGENGYEDSHEIINKLKPLNPYGESKNDFDLWVLKQNLTPPFWAGLKFFNVYGPNEYHKGRMASVIFHAFNQIQASQKMKLFRSHNKDYKNGEQLRDFIYVKDVISICMFLHSNRPTSGIYNVGTGKARSFNDLTTNTFKALKINTDISYIDTPSDIRDKYQYFTEANMNKLISVGYTKPFTSLEDGVKDYVNNYLEDNLTY
ncbi:MAG: ADP-glyceromanno-heptose 6-epimerase [Crocinitomicaceae bacterium]|nr:ADP-glyceromanno-heptose 6-epimerase [Crocinitomicaceae bacterium]